MDSFRSKLSNIIGEKKPALEQAVDKEPGVMSCTRMAMDVTGTRGNKIGTIETIMIDYETGRVPYAMVAFERSTGLGDELFPIPWEAFNMSTAKERLILNIPTERLQNAPNISRADWKDEAPGRGWITSVYNFYGFTPYWARR